MNIGIDAHVLRALPTGIYSYVSNLVWCFSRMQTNHNSVSLMFYGPRCFDTEERMTQIARKFPAPKIAYLWDGWPLGLFSKNVSSELVSRRSAFQIVDKRLAVLWRKLHKDYPSLAFAKSRSLAKHHLK